MNPTFRRSYPWLAYGLGILALNSGWEQAGAIVFLSGMLFPRHLKWWVLGIVAFWIGLWWGSDSA